MENDLIVSCLKRLWAKTNPFYPLFQHLIDVGVGVGFLLRHSSYRCLGEKLARSFGAPLDQSVPWCQYLCAMHDIGKCHPLFQGKADTDFSRDLKAMGKIPAIVTPGFRHEAFSDDWVYRLLKETFDWKRGQARTMGSILHGHHGNYFSKVVPEPGSLSAFWEEVRQEFAHMLLNVFDPPELKGHTIAHHSNTGVILSGLCVLSDWVVSNSEVFEMGVFDGFAVDYAPISEKRVSDAFRKIGSPESITWPRRPLFRQVWSNLGIRELRPIQENVESLVQDDIEPGLVIIEAPMGEGKTEAALHLAAHWIGRNDLSGLYIGLPTAATSNQMYQRVKSLLSQHLSNSRLPIKLIHGRAWLIDELTPHKEIETDQENGYSVHEWFSPKKRSLLSPYGVGTVDQAMFSALNVKFGFLRQLSLSGKAFVIDEVHAYDAYMSQIIERLLAWCASLETPVILLSATLPSAKKRAFIQAYRSGKNFPDQHWEVSSEQHYPLLSVSSLTGEYMEYPVQGAAKTQTIEIAHHPFLNDTDSIADLISPKISKVGGVYCCIVNTVRNAQQLYKSLRQRMPETELLLYHARFLAGRRQQIEEEALRRYDKRSLLPVDDPERQERPKTSLLIATQVVEQSLDVDFDEMFTEIAPIDLLLQRAGRLHRHSGRTRPTGKSPTLHIFGPKENEWDWGSTGKVYEPFILAKTRWLLQGKTQLKLPEEIRCLVESVYNDEKDIPDSFIAPSKIDQFYDRMKESQAQEENEARQYLLPKPNKESYMIVDRASHAYEEEEEGMGDFFRASTRMGNNTCTLLVLRDEDASGPDFRNTDKKRLKELMLSTTSVPRWWLRDVEPDAGYAKIEEARNFPVKALVLRTDDGGRWKGKGLANSGVTITNDRELGITYEKTEVKSD